MADSGIGDLDEQLQQVQMTDADQNRIELKRKVDLYSNFLQNNWEYLNKDVCTL